jgi:NAD-reducing hydrogenase large subunit
MKFPYYKPLGYPKGIYRVGPLARLNNADACGTPFADVALAEFRTLQEDSGPVASSFHYHYARLVEIIFAIESMQRLLKDPRSSTPGCAPAPAATRARASASPRPRAAP